MTPRLLLVEAAEEAVSEVAADVACVLLSTHPFWGVCFWIGFVMGLDGFGLMGGMRLFAAAEILKGPLLTLFLVRSSVLVLCGWEGAV